MEKVEGKGDRPSRERGWIVYKPLHTLTKIP